MTTNNNEHYNFYEDRLWTGRLASFTKSIDSNLKLLRVILLTKGSTIMEFSKLLGKGLLKVNERMDGYALPNNFKTYTKPLSEVQNAAISLLEGFGVQSQDDEGSEEGEKLTSGLLGGTWGNALSRISSGGDRQSKDNVDEDDLVGLVNFKFEETQLYNLRTLSLNQKTFVNNRLKNCVKATLDKVNKSKNSEEINEIALIRKSFQNIATDIEIVQRAIVQRVHEVDDDGNYAPSMQASALQITDMLALLALKPFQHLLPKTSDIVPITFFSQETHIQSVPYCDNVILIGIRYDQVLQNLKDPSTPPPFELLAIPHEIGHYIYQRAIIKDRRALLKNIVSKEFGRVEWSVEASGKEGLSFKDVSGKLPLTYERHRKWCEEIFADICGCIVAGPLVALSLLSILVSRADDDNRNTDGEHPTGILRPFILKEILDVLNELRPKKYTYNLVAQDLIDTWEGVLDKFGHEKTEDQTKEIKAIRKIIRVFARFLLGDKSTSNFKLWSPTNISGLNDCATELKKIKTLSGFDGLEPAKLGKTAPEDGSDITDLINEWKKKGPVTIGPH